MKMEKGWFDHNMTIDMIEWKLGRLKIHLERMETLRDMVEHDEKYLKQKKKFDQIASETKEFIDNSKDRQREIEKDFQEILLELIDVEMVVDEYPNECAERLIENHFGIVEDAVVEVYKL